MTTWPFSKGGNKRKARSENPGPWARERKVVMTSRPLPKRRAKGGKAVTTLGVFPNRRTGGGQILMTLWLFLKGKIKGWQTTLNPFPKTRARGGQAVIFFVSDSSVYW